ncbi:uncharacterized protein PHACADRAFT_31877 [Phanerochaete carnosa HHB-10118-sp]|uniref:Uncharacterized protein n=1 Tax=Phanerochaete carnosa (strain HHB-10118-sp) TaxID=650164 RepID=K5UQL2_PHACS|nr:uncharacterized protein PHACADRAFT_31877 [Phanerochaete carnosa HHB-10118-sp]EKM52121.1 hypothetical protein PHACADRAFT_31877 [Phanerochaete carnosa HHB-10118-sp]
MNMFYKSPALSTEARSGNAEYSDVTDERADNYLAAEYSSHRPNATRCLLTWPVGAAYRGTGIVRLLNDEDTARLRLHATTHDRSDVVGNEIFGVWAHRKEWTLHMLDRQQRSMMEEIASKRPTVSILCQKAWI